MQEIVLNIHSVWRWVVIPAAAAAIVLALMVSAGRRPWDRLADRLSLLFVIGMDVQVLTGILLWVIEGRWAGDPMVGWLHPLVMLGAVGLAHVGRRRADAANDDRARGRAALIFFLASLVLVIAAIPFYSWPI